jgi:outer membrane protein
MITFWNDMKYGLRRPGKTPAFAALALSMVIVLAGCPSASVPADARLEATKARLSQIDTVQLEDRSATKPVTVAQATADVIQEANEPNVAVPAMKLTLDEVRASALANNLDLKIDRIDPAMAQARLDAERAKFEAAFTGDLQYDRARDSGSTSETTSLEVGVVQPLATGGSLSVGMPLNDAQLDTYGLADAAVSVAYIQSLCRGAGTRINTQSIRIAAHEKGIVDAQTKLSAIHILANADVGYWRLYAARKELEVRREQYKLAQDQLKHARGKVASGAAPKIEIVRADAGLASRLEEVINAETSLRSAERDLRRVMNRPDMPLDATVEIIPTSEPNPLGLTLDPDRLVREALANRMEVAELELRLTIDQLDMELARNQTLPDVTFNYRYTGGAEGDTVGGAFGHLGSTSSDEHVIALSATIPFGHRAASARLERARLQRLRDQASQDRLRQAIRQEVYEAVSELNKDWRRILAAEQGVVAAYRDYRVEQSQFELGLRTSTDVLYSATGLANAQLRRIYAMAEYEVARINLARATGTLLGYGRIRLGDDPATPPVAANMGR